MVFDSILSLALSNIQISVLEMFFFFNDIMPYLRILTIHLKKHCPDVGSPL